MTRGRSSYNYIIYMYIYIYIYLFIYLFIYFSNQRSRTEALSQSLYLLATPVTQHFTGFCELIKRNEDSEHYTCGLSYRELVSLQNCIFRQLMQSKLGSWRCERTCRAHSDDSWHLFGTTALSRTHFGRSCVKNLLFQARDRSSQLWNTENLVFLWPCIMDIYNTKKRTNPTITVY